MSRARLSLRLTALVVMSAVAVAVIAAGSLREPEGAEQTPAVRSDLLGRWERWRRVTAAYTESSERRSGNEELSSDVQVWQRFPDIVVRDGTDISARVGGRLVGCSGAGAAARCQDNGAYDADGQLATELADLRDLTTGALAPYRLTRLSDGCFRLRHVVEEFRPRWGDRLDLCFDGSTGMLVKEETVKGPLTITVRRTAVRLQVDDADLDVPAVPTPIGGG